MSNFDTYLVLLPTESDGVDYGYLAPTQVLALDERDAVKKAAEKWWGRAVKEGTAIVVKADDATAFILGELRGVEIVAESSLPNQLAEISAS